MPNEKPSNSKVEKKSPQKVANDESKPSLVTKLAHIGKEIGAVDKSGKNSVQGYAFIEYGVVAGKIRELFDHYNVIIVPETTGYEIQQVKNAKNNIGYHYVLQMRFTIINGDNMSEQLSADWMGEATDFGDKGINKAETSGTKYFLMRLFNVSEKGENEADKDTPEMTEAEDGHQYHASPEKPASEKQLGLIRSIMAEQGYNPDMIDDSLLRVKTSADASNAITKLKARVAA